VLADGVAGLVVDGVFAGAFVAGLATGFCGPLSCESLVVGPTRGVSVDPLPVAGGGLVPGVVGGLLIDGLSGDAFPNPEGWEAGGVAEFVALGVPPGAAVAGPLLVPAADPAPGGDVPTADPADAGGAPGAGPGAAMTKGTNDAKTAAVPKAVTILKNAGAIGFIDDSSSVAVQVAALFSRAGYPFAIRFTGKSASCRRAVAGIRGPKTGPALRTRRQRCRSARAYCCQPYVTEPGDPICSVPGGAAMDKGSSGA
jgi:hypothetical protein